LNLFDYRFFLSFILPSHLPNGVCFGFSQLITCLVLLSDAGSGGRTAIPVTSLKVGDEVLVRKQGGARHTGIEIHEFIVEK
jgi:hypothetical protein